MSITFLTSVAVFKSAVFDDTSLSGGGPSTDTISLLGDADLFGTLTSDQLNSGVTQFRKLFIKSTDPTHTSVGYSTFSPLVFLFSDEVVGGDSLRISLGDQSDTEASARNSGYDWATTFRVVSASDPYITFPTPITSGASLFFLTPNTSLVGSDPLDILSLASLTGTELETNEAHPRLYDSSFLCCGCLKTGSTIDMYNTGIPIWVSRTIPASCSGWASRPFRLGIIWD
jgi:hypothetical protein